MPPGLPAIQAGLGRVLEEETRLRRFRSVSAPPESEREARRETLRAIATYLELFHAVAVTAELTWGAQCPRKDLPRMVESITKVDLHRLFAESQEYGVQDWFAGVNASEATREPSDPRAMQEIVQIIEKLTHELDEKVLVFAAEKLDSELATRAMKAYRGLCAFVRRHDPYVELRVRVLGEDYCAGRLSVQAVAAALGRTVPDTLALLERYGYSRPLSVSRLTSERRDRIYRAMREDRIRRRGEPEPSLEWIARDVIATQRIEGIDSRDRFGDTLGRRCETRTTTTPLK